MPEKEKPIRTQIMTVNLLVAGITVLLAMAVSLAMTLKQDRDIMDRNLMNSAQVIARVPMVLQDLQAGAPTEELTAFLDESVAKVDDIDVIVVADVVGLQYYATNHDRIGKIFPEQEQIGLLRRAEILTSDQAGDSGASRCAYAPVRAEDGTLLGFVMVGVYMRSVSTALLKTALFFLGIAAVAFLVGGLISSRLSRNIKHDMKGYEPGALVRLFEQRDDILQALEEGLMAIDTKGRVLYLNRAAADMVGADGAAAIGRPLHEVLPRSTLDRVLKTRLPEYNLSVVSGKKVHILSDHTPVWENGRIVGAVAIFRNRTEAERLAEDLTGVRHMVDAMRAYTHDFMNRLHVILGLLQLGEAEEAEAYIMDVTDIHQKAVGAIMSTIRNPSVAALLVGKTSRCAELGIRFVLTSGSRLSADEGLLPADAYVTVLGNLIDNATDALNRKSGGLKQISVSLVEETDSLLICVEDTGPGMPPEIARNVFKKGFSTKGRGRGTGLALVREVTEACQGEIRMESEPGVGTAFFLTFRRGEEEGRV